MVTTLVLHVGLPHLPERHPGSPPEVDLRLELRRGHADPVLLLLGVFRVLDSVRQDHRAHRLSEDDGRRPAHHGTGRAAVHSGGERAVVPAVSRGAHHSRGRYHRVAGIGESLRRSAGSGAHRVQPPESDAGVQFARHDGRTFLRRAADSGRGHSQDSRRTARPIAASAAHISPGRSLVGEAAVSGHRAGPDSCSAS